MSLAPLVRTATTGRTRHFIRGLCEKPDESLQELWNASRRIRQRSRQNLAYRMKLVLQLRHHTEVAASPANRPKKIWIGLLAGLDHVSHPRSRLAPIAGCHMQHHTSPSSDLLPRRASGQQFLPSGSRLMLSRAQNAASLRPDRARARLPPLAPRVCRCRLQLVSLRRGQSPRRHRTSRTRAGYGLRHAPPVANSGPGRIQAHARRRSAPAQRTITAGRRSNARLKIKRADFVLGAVRCDYMADNLGTSFRIAAASSGAAFCSRASKIRRALAKHLNWASASSAAANAAWLDELSSSSERHIRLHNSQPQLLPASFARDIQSRVCVCNTPDVPRAEQ